MRAMCLYANEENAAEVVVRCPYHVGAKDPWNDGHPAPQHLIRCSHIEAQYIEDPITKRLSVVVPYEFPQGILYSTCCWSGA